MALFIILSTADRSVYWLTTVATPIPSIKPLATRRPMVSLAREPMDPRCPNIAVMIILLVGFHRFFPLPTYPKLT